jgi:hypothetical protein
MSDGGNEPSMWDVRLGFEVQHFFGYWLTIEDYDEGAKEPEDYIFHNLRDVPGKAMTLPEVEEKLADYGIGLPQELAVELARNGLNAHYHAALKEEDRERYEVFHNMWNRAVIGPWKPRGKLPLSWRSLDRD